MHFMQMAGSALDVLRGFSVQWEQAVQSAFFMAIFEYLDQKIDTFQYTMLEGVWQLVMGLALTLATIWVLWQGWLIMSGRSKESLMGLVVGSLRTVLILVAATTFTFGSTDLYRMFTDSLPRQVNKMVNDSSDLPAEEIDGSLQAIDAIMVALGQLPGMDNTSAKQDKDRALLMAGVGTAGPMVIGGALLMMYKLALALFVGFGPLFILSLLFEQTKGMFSKWLYYGIGTMFAMAVFAFTVSVAMEMITSVGLALAAQILVSASMPGGAPTGVSTLAMQQGGLGMILTVLLIMVPPMAAAFFNGVLGHFAAYSAFGMVGRGGTDAAGRTPGQAGYQGGAPAGTGDRAGERGGGVDTRSTYNAPNPGAQTKPGGIY